ncbi:LysR substrate-binding domain-containing protein [Radicibacter daui]|uniref:LysR substrate-binding domain-containing protein n=1 Tax=Radicibacter daui TaxID=3064829 RepID=UPI004046BD1F
MTTDLPPLTALRAFEAVARRGTIQAAADELHVVRGAIGQQLRLLEQHLGISLFTRQGRRLVLSEAGERFAGAVSAAFAVISRAAQEVAPTGGRRRFRLGATDSWAALWLIPRLPAFLAMAPGFDLDIVPVAVPRNLEDTDLDGVIVGGEYEPRPEIAGFRFLKDEFGPVATPAVLAGLDLAQGPEGLRGATALAARTPRGLWTAWFHESGTRPVRFARRLEFEGMTLALSAARAGLGIVMAPRALIGQELATGLLAAPFGFIERPGGYHFCCRAGDQNLPAFRQVRQWLEEAGAALA